MDLGYFERNNSILNKYRQEAINSFIIPMSINPKTNVIGIANKQIRYQRACVKFIQIISDPWNAKERMPNPQPKITNRS